MNRPTPFSFDGHGINDAEGQRLAKVSLARTIDVDRDENHPHGIADNPEFLELSRLFKASPALLDIAQAINLCIPQKLDHNEVKITLTAGFVEDLREAIQMTQED